MTVYAKDTVTTKISRNGYDQFCCEAYVTTGKVTFHPEAPYQIQDGTFRLFTTQQVLIRDRINKDWRIHSMTHPVAGRVFCKARRVYLEDPREVDLVEIVKRQGKDAHSMPEFRYRIAAGRLQHDRNVTVTDDRRGHTNDSTYVLCDHLEKVIPGRWQIKDGNDYYTIVKVEPPPSPDLPGYVVCRLDAYDYTERDGAAVAPPPVAPPTIDDLESLTEMTESAITGGPIMVFDLESATELTTGGIAPLLPAVNPDDMESATELTTSDIYGAIIPGNLESATELTTSDIYGPVIPVNLESATELTTSSVNNRIKPNDLESATELTTSDIYGPVIPANLESATELTTSDIYGPVIPDNLESATELTTSDIYGPVIPANLESATELTTSSVNSKIKPDDLESATEITGSGISPPAWGLFDGIDDYIQLPVPLGIPTTYSIQGRFQTVQSSNAVMFDARDAIEDGVLLQLNSNGTLRGEHSLDNVTTVGVYNDGSWHDFELAWDGATFSLTVDLETASTSTNAAMNLSQNMRIGARSYSTPTDFYAGSMSEVTVQTTV